ncbi:apolipoprotein N-acyltransferase [Rapidithrix thailandica]|uniref:Apolipoprotein N-acyltransferase n=1 Tax=Rapidithrix thailandica TaxID=413964 RepID=A0AAW9S0N0_9BACT
MIKNIEHFRKHKFYPLLLSALTGGLLSLAWYPPLTPLVFIALVPLLELERTVSQHYPKWPKLTLFLYTYLGFLLWNIGVYWWLWNASGWMTLAAWGANAALQSLPVLVYQIIKKRSGGRYHYLAFVTSWLSFEYLHLHWDLSWVWMNMGNVFHRFPEWVQWYEYTGSFGGALWVLVANIFAYRIWSEKRAKVQFAMTIIFPLVASYYVYFTYEEQGAPVEVVVVQPNLDCYHEKFTYNAKTGESSQATHVPYPEQVDRLLKLSGEQISPNTQFVAWPETSLHEYFNEKNALLNDEVRKVYDYFKEQQDHVSLVTGGDSYITYEKGKAPKLARYRESMGYYDVFNTAMFIGDTDSLGFYRKSKLVIGAETTPFAEWLSPVILNFGGVSGRLGSQEEREVFVNSQGVAVAPVICYESVYGEFVTEYIHQGANLIFIITNDGWWGDTPGHIQHLLYGALRAIETRRSIARAANTGISGFINQKGELTQVSKYDEMIALKAEIKANDQQTFYTKYGDYLGRLAAFIVGLMFVSAFVIKRIS